VENPGSHAHAIRTARASFVTYLPPRRCPGSSVRQRRFTPAQPLELVSSSDALGQPHFRCRSLDHVFDGRIHNRLCTPASSRHIATSMHEVPRPRLRWSDSQSFVYSSVVTPHRHFHARPSRLSFVSLCPHDRNLDSAADVATFWHPFRCRSSTRSLARCSRLVLFVVRVARSVVVVLRVRRGGLRLTLVRPRSVAHTMANSLAFSLYSSSPRTVSFFTLDDVWTRSYFRTRRVRSRRPLVGFVESAFRSVGLNVHVSVVVLDYCAASDECV
jgi:hypothetical protein